MVTVETIRIVLYIIGFALILVGMYFFTRKKNPGKPWAHIITIILGVLLMSSIEWFVNTGLNFMSEHVPTYLEGIILDNHTSPIFSEDNSIELVPDNTPAQTNANVGTETEPVHTHTWQDATCTQAKTCSVCGATEGSPILDIVAGDTITMGYYGNENIVWTVLEFDPSTNQALLISKYCIDAIPFHTGSDYGSWENSTLRKWMNNDFISTAFTQEERATILTKTIPNPDNPDYGIDSGSDTSDRVFLLSYEEAVYYFPSKASRQGEPTDYCWDQGCYDPVKYGEEHGTEVSPEAVGYTWWWLRTAGLDEKHTCNVVAKGTASTYGAYKTSNEGAVRPAMWVQLG